MSTVPKTVTPVGWPVIDPASRLGVVEVHAANPHKASTAAATRMVVHGMGTPAESVNTLQGQKAMVTASHGKCLGGIPHFMQIFKYFTILISKPAN